MHNPTHRATSLLISVLIATLALPPVSLAKERITCESQNYRYHYCKVDTDNRVKLKDQISRSPCIEGQTWGYDQRGVWVTSGCAAEFEVGTGKNSGGNAALLGGAAAIGAAVLGGLLGGGTGQPADSSANPDYSPGNPPYPPAGTPSPATAAPAWAVGTFRGFDQVYNMDVELTINPNGSVSGYAQNRPLQGSLSGQQLRLGEATFYVKPDSRGFRAVQANDARNQVRYFRIR